MEQATFEDWKKLEMKVGKVMEAEKVPKTEKLYKLRVDVGCKTIQIVSSIAPYYSQEELKGKKIVVLTNLKPASFGGEASEGMLLCAESEKTDKCVLISPEKDVEQGTAIT